MSDAAEQRGLIQQWLAVNPGTEEQAQFYLEANNWDLNAALSNFNEKPPLSEGLHHSSNGLKAVHGLVATDVAELNQPQSRRLPLFTMGSHSEASDSDSPESYSESLSDIHSHRNLNGSELKRNSDIHNDSKSNLKQEPLSGRSGVEAVHECCKSASNGRSNACNTSIGKNNDGHSHSPCTLHLCKATTSLSQLHSTPDGEQTDALATDMERSKVPPVAPMRHDRLASAPPERKSVDLLTKSDNDNSGGDILDEERGVSEPHCRIKGKAMTKEPNLKPRKKVTGKKPHNKRTASTAALRTRIRHGGGGNRRDYLLAKPLLKPSNNGEGDGSYVDYSGNSSFGDEGGVIQTDHQQQQTGDSLLPAADYNMIATDVNVLDQAKGSLNSSTATLGIGAAQDVDDSATTASIDSPRQEGVDELNSREDDSGCNNVGQQQQQHQESSRVVDSASPKASFSDIVGETNLNIGFHQGNADIKHSKSNNHHGSADIRMSSNEGNISQADSIETQSNHRADDSGTQQTGPNPGRRQRRHIPAGPSEQTSFHGQGSSNNSSRVSDEQTTHVGSSQTTYIAKGSKRNIETQRQQGIVEKEEEDMEIANSHLTGVPRRNNRPEGMLPHVFLLPDQPAYGQQVRKTDRIYAYSRTAAHPLLESMVRCTELREQRLAQSASRGSSRPWMSRRMLTEPSETDSQMEWWDSLMPPPPSSVPREEQRLTSAHGPRMQLTNLPSWMIEPDEAKRAVYGTEIDLAPIYGQHDSVDPSCPHSRELRARAKELRISRQHNAIAGRSNVPPPMRITGSASGAALETWRGRRIPGLLNVDMYAGAVGPLDSAGVKQNRGWLGTETPFSSSPESTNIQATRGNHLAPPYRRYGTVYGYTAANTTGTRSSGNAGVSGAAGGGSGGTQASLRSNSRGHESMPSSRSGTAGIWENDPRRSSYFDRISVDEPRPSIASSAATQTTPAGLLRRVISGLTGATATAFGTSQ
ncbi:hypothetical protein IWW48_003375 [Coemansia sp. RSA 1200]|nr:hypothetical protein IWW48_003375 [Coemansia sp. RSA 1200]